MYTGLYTLAMITTLMPHLRIGLYKEGVLIAQIQMPFHAVGRSFPYELLIIYTVDREIFVVQYFRKCSGLRKFNAQIFFNNELLDHFLKVSTFHTCSQVQPWLY